MVVDSSPIAGALAHGVVSTTVEATVEVETMEGEAVVSEAELRNSAAERRISLLVEEY